MGADESKTEQNKDAPKPNISKNKKIIVVGLGGMLLAAWILWVTLSP